MSRQTIVMILLSLTLLLVVLLFSFLLLIPKGKEYRTLRLESKKEMQSLERAQRDYNQARDRLEELKGANRHIISAFRTPFNAERFTKLNKKEFQDLYLTEVTARSEDGMFKVYEVNATSKITSPQSFYHFLESVNKSDWIIGVNFPVYFERDGDKIRSSFTMKVHNNPKTGKKEKT
ncbi:MAG: hypothetical protein M0P91_01005 [Sulfuricurvum sp.]|jgi:hypothetical protein|uniref:hypothetical protein n=1 Tax=Sulfuricurvum sp. TaxID=2025608 RepID=UPI0025F8E316|nr:hypothetical protein [Sulfuricurvum sp.]MCK9371747.1 hypothetical protein [Sulfuricurvum sp.]